MDVTIIIPLYKPDKEILTQIKKRIKEQNFSGKINIIELKDKGLAEGLNWGIRNSKTEIIISLHQDCIPSSKDWLQNLVEPLKNKNVVASVSKVELPYNFWKHFGYFARIMSIKEQKIITPLLDEKGCAYKKSAIEKVGFFDEITFRTAGEDFDIYIKLKKIGKIVYPKKVKVFHYHKHTFQNRIKKEKQLSEGFGCLIRNYGGEMPSWWKGVIKAIPLVGWLFFWIQFPYYRMFFGGLIWIILSFYIHLLYVIYFWKGFINRRQKI
jgi:hypothetical protein